MKSYMKYFKGDVKVVPMLYHDGNSGLQLIDAESHEPIAKATVNIGLKAGIYQAVVIKDYSENEGVLETLIKGGIFKPHGTVPMNHAEVTIGHVIDPDLLEMLYELEREYRIQHAK